MARSHLTLAALATAAVSGLDVVSTSSHGSGEGDFDSALLTARDGSHWIIRVPRSQAAESTQSADAVGLRALSTGVRSRLPFQVPAIAGQAAIGPTRAMVSEYLYGSIVRLADIDAELAGSIGHAIAAIHSLPTSFVADAGLPQQTAHEVLRTCVGVMDRASETGLVPSALLGRWERATEEPVLWQFAPTVINDALSPDSFLSAGGSVTAVLGWQGLKVGDPASDLAWLLGAGAEDVTAAAFASYARERGGNDRHLRARAVLQAELEVAKWLLHGTASRSTEIVDDAVEMLHAIVDSTAGDLDDPVTGATTAAARATASASAAGEASARTATPSPASAASPASPVRPASTSPSSPASATEAESGLAAAVAASAAAADAVRPGAARDSARTASA
ncbi:MAG: phosphotransferase [Microbacteriaceae bacterium]